MQEAVMRRVAILILLATGWALPPPVRGQALGPVVLEDAAGRRVTLAAGQSVTVGRDGLGELRQVLMTSGYRATFCDSPAVSARCGRLVGPSGQGAAGWVFPPMAASGTVVTVEQALFGYADLHVHPATHLAFGSRGGGQGLLWGRPGLSLAAANPAIELASCPSDKHSGFTASPVEHAARIALTEIAEQDNPDHGSSGYPSFSDWPASDSVIHQQVHVTMLRRAYDGGLRLMVASATDSQIFDVVWNPVFSVSQGRFVLRAEFDHNSATRQLDFIRQLVGANQGWMALATTPAQAREAIAENKLAVVLALEMDELSMAQILALQASHGVALVNPVHLTNNSFGGAAVYGDIFNGANYLLNGQFFRVRDDATVDFRLSTLPALQLPVVGPLVSPVEVAAANANYDAAPNGHRNRVGLLDEYGLRRLMKAGLLIDLAHMSSSTTDRSLALARDNGYPMVYTHGGRRDLGPSSERALTLRQHQDLVASGGIFGVGTGRDPSDPSPVATWLGRYLEIASWGPAAIGSDLNGMAPQLARSEVGIGYPISAIRTVDWTGRSGSLQAFRLGTKTFDVAGDGIAHIGMLPDFVAAVRRRAQDGAPPRVREVDQIFHSAHDFIATWERARRAAAGVNDDLPDAPVETLELEVETGTDDLKCGGVFVSVWASGDRMISHPAMIGLGLAPNTAYAMALRLMPGARLPDVWRVRLQYLNNQCDLFDTGDAWNIRTLKVAYQVTGEDGPSRGVLMHKRGGPARQLDRGDTWNVYVER
jgi:microsomal dipeptidase-like Zn-dependent dipeptidase